MSEHRAPENLEPAEHVEPAPLQGWSAAELDETDLVDDQFIAEDPDEEVIVRGSLQSHTR